MIPLRAGAAAAALACTLIAAHARPAGAQDSVRVSASLARNTVEVGRTTTLEIVITTDGARPESIDAPPMPVGLRVVGTQDVSQNRFALPGGRTHIRRRLLTIEARATGQHRIGAAEVVVDGQTYRTAPIRLTVVAAAAGADADAAGEISLHAAAVPDTAYVGQQIVLDAEARFGEAARQRVRGTPEFELPTPSGFLTRDPPRRPDASRRTSRGQVLARRAERIYFPVRAGEFTLQPVRLAYEYRRGFFYTPERRELESEPIRIVVRPLPDRGRPDSFTGAVGRFDVRGWIEPGSVPVGEAAVLHIEVTGEGQIRTLPPPELPEVEGVRFYPPAERSDESIREGRVEGSKRFTWVVVPERSGTLELPPIEYAYFDPETGEYERARTAALELTARPAADGAVATPADDAGPVALRPLRPEPAGPPALAWVRSPAFAALQLLPLLAFVALYWHRRRSSAAPRVSLRKLRRGREDALGALHARVDDIDDRGFFRDLGRLVRGAIADRLGSDDLRHAEPRVVRDSLVDIGLDARAAEGAASLLARLESARYQPDAPDADARQTYLRAAARLLERIDAAAPKPATGSGAVRRLLSLAILAIAVPATGTLADRAAATAASAPAASTAPAAPQSAESSGAAGSPSTSEAADFRAATDAYRAGDHAGAIERLTRHLRDRPDDVNAWYNLGNAYHRAGEDGRAAWAWLRALALAPRDADVRGNLRLVGTSQALVARVRPRPPLASDEFLLVIAVAWLLGASALVVYATRRRPAPLGAGLAGIAAAVVLATAFGLSRSRATIGIVLHDDAPVRSAPAPRAELLRALEAGSGLEVVAAEADWLHVRDFDRREGWIEAASIGIVPPRARGADGPRP